MPIHDAIAPGGSTAREQFPKHADEEFLPKLSATVDRSHSNVPLQVEKKWDNGAGTYATRFNSISSHVDLK